MIMTQAGRVWVFDVQSEGGGCPRPRHLCTDSLTIDSTWFWGQRRRQTLGTMWKNPLCVSVPYKHTYIHTYVFIYLYTSLSISHFLSFSPFGKCCVWLAACHMPIGRRRHCWSSVPPVPHTPTATPTSRRTHIHTPFAPGSLGEYVGGEKHTEISLSSF